MSFLGDKFKNEFYIDLGCLNSYIVKTGQLIEKVEESSRTINNHMDEVKTIAWEGNAAQAFIEYHCMVKIILEENETRLKFLKSRLEKAETLFSELEVEAKGLNKF